MKRFLFGTIALALSAASASAEATWSSIDVMEGSDGPIAFGIKNTLNEPQTYFPPVEGKYCGGESWTTALKDAPPEAFVEATPCDENVLICMSDFPDMTDAQCVTGSKPND